METTLLKKIIQAIDREVSTPDIYFLWSVEAQTVGIQGWYDKGIPPSLQTANSSQCPHTAVKEGAL
jgi:hypothetical protein